MVNASISILGWAAHSEHDLQQSHSATLSSFILSTFALLPCILNPKKPRHIHRLFAFLHVSHHYPYGPVKRSPNQRRRPA